jgi:hypothetical protein
MAATEKEIQKAMVDFLKAQPIPVGMCAYCKQEDELRPYGKHGVMICFDCGMLPENENVTRLMATKRIVEIRQFVINRLNNGQTNQD